MAALKAAVKKSIDAVFAQQKQHALALRKSDYKQRLAVLARFESVFKVSYDKIHAAAAADFGKPEVWKWMPQRLCRWSLSSNISVNNLSSG